MFRQRAPRVPIYGKPDFNYCENRFTPYDLLQLESTVQEASERPLGGSLPARCEAQIDGTTNL
jgi:hypothetical protein